MGNIIGDPAEPIPEGTFIFRDCRIRADRGLSLSNVLQKNFDGLEAELPAGVQLLNFIETGTSGSRQRQ